MICLWLAPFAPAQNVLALASDLTPNSTDVADKLADEGLTVTRMSVASATPTLAEVLPFDAVLVYGQFAFGDAAALGDVVADYVDAGGGAVIAQFAATTGLDLRGRFKDDDYGAMTSAGALAPGEHLLVAVLPDHPVLAGVVGFHGGNDSIRSGVSLRVGATRVANWDDGALLAAEHQPSGAGRVVALNLYPPSSDAVPDGWKATTDGGRLMANALTFAANLDADSDGYTRAGGDCDDSDPDRHPDANETCNGLDDDCDGALLPDENDGDGDGSGPCMGDCDDANGAMAPGLPEICDGLDNDCDPLTDELLDGDGDGASVCDDDCNDTEPTIGPDAKEACNGGIDDDCNPFTDELGDADFDLIPYCDDVCADGPDFDDIDGDGVSDWCDPCPLDGPAGDDDGDGNCNSVDKCPGYDDDADRDLDGLPDACDPCPDVRDERDADGDGDGFGGACDCDDGASAAYPGAPEMCDGIDNDCNGVIDGPTSLDALALFPDVDGDGFGGGEATLSDCAAGPGAVGVGGDCDDTNPAVRPAAVEQCNGVDDDCDGVTDPQCDSADEVEPATCGCRAPGTPSPMWGLLAVAWKRRRAPTRIRA